MAEVNLYSTLLMSELLINCAVHEHCTAADHYQRLL